MSQIATRLNDVPHSPFELLGLGETTVRFAVPEDLVLDLQCVCCGIGLVVGDFDDEDAACAGLEGDFT